MAAKFHQGPLLLALCLALTLTLTCSQDNTPKENPFLIRQKQNQRQEMQKMKLQQLQQQMQGHGLKSQPSRKAKDAQDYSATDEVALKQVTQQQGSENRKQGVMHNRNEMHKHGGPGPTAWTRWTAKPKRRGSPWNSQHKTNGKLARCAGQLYSAREHICCQDNLQKRQGLRPACCGSLAFDFVFSLCCKGKISARTAGQPFC